MLETSLLGRCLAEDLTLADGSVIERNTEVDDEDLRRIADDTSDPFRRSDDGAERRFRAALHRAGTFTHKRYSGGSDIAAACGQLAARAG